MTNKVYRAKLYYRYRAGPNLTYDLILIYHNTGGKSWVIEAELYSTNDRHFMGTWSSKNVPAGTLRQFNAWLRLKVRGGWSPHPGERVVG
jgi:hypothetical protein